MPNLRSKIWTPTTLANVEDAQYWEDHLISAEDATKAHGAVQDAFKTIEVQSGGSTTNVVANKEDAVTLEAGTNITLTAIGKNIRINSTGGGGGGGSYTASKGIIISDSDIEADLKDYDLSSEEATAFGSTANRTYAVGLDSNGDLAVNIPWNGTIENLLDNPFFTVNQRGQTTYTANGIYTFDRWKKWAGTISISGIVKTLAVDSGLGYGIITQNLEDYSYLEGKKLTMSVMLSDDTVLSGTATFVNSSTSVTFFNNSSVIMDFDSGSFRFIVFTDTTFKAIKLEFGNVSTLGMDTAPNYAEELLKCQKYFQRWVFAQYATVGTCEAAPTYCNLFIPSVKMRTLPTKYLTGSLAFVSTEDITFALDYISEYAGGYVIHGNRTTSGNSTSGYAYASDAGGLILDLSADL